MDSKHMDLGEVPLGIASGITGNTPETVGNTRDNPKRRMPITVRSATKTHISVV